jgi:hypothetical protein
LLAAARLEDERRPRGVLSGSLTQHERGIRHCPPGAAHALDCTSRDARSSIRADTADAPARRSTTGRSARPAATPAEPRPPPRGASTRPSPKFAPWPWSSYSPRVADALAAAADRRLRRLRVGSASRQRRPRRGNTSRTCRANHVPGCPGRRAAPTAAPVLECEVDRSPVSSGSGATCARQVDDVVKRASPPIRPPPSPAGSVR